MTAIVAPCGGGLFSIVFGIIALVQIRRTRQRGKGLAIAGLITTGACAVAIPVIALLVAANTTQPRDDDGRIAHDGLVSVDSLRAGDCLNGLAEQISFRVPGVPCDEPHEGEVYGVFSLSGGDWPGEEAITSESRNTCLNLLAGYSSTASYDDQVTVYRLEPTRPGWGAGDREVVCIAYFLDGPRTGSVADS